VAHSASPLQPRATPKPHRFSAADQLAGFFTAAEHADQQIRHATRLINGGIHADVIVLDQRTVRAVKGIDTRSVVRAIPGGLNARQLRSVLQVYADLSSRRAAFNRVLEYADQSPLPRTSTNAKDLVTCLSHGASAAARFADDLAASRTLAAASAPVTIAPARSRLTAEVAIHAHSIDLPNNGCGECGGVVPRPILLHPIVWQRIDHGLGSVWDGTIGTSGLFTARYIPGQGWDATSNAC
jgi:hypothetical protein